MNASKVGCFRDRELVSLSSKLVVAGEALFEHHALQGHLGHHFAFIWLSENREVPFELGFRRLARPDELARHLILMINEHGASVNNLLYVVAR